VSSTAARIRAPLPSIAILIIAIVVVAVDVEHLEQIPMAGLL
jgi:hypothetical protein